MTVVGEDYAPLGSTEFGTIVNKVKASKADAVFNTLNGDSNVAFFKEYKSAGPDRRRRMPVRLGVDRRGGGQEHRHAVPREGQLTAWNYYQTTPGAANDEVRRGVQGRSTARTSRPATRWRPPTSRSTSGRRWSRRPARSTWRRCKAASDGITFDAPEGTVTVDGATQHIYKTARIGKVGADGLINEVWNSGEPIKPDPYLKGYTWAAGLS